MAAAAAVARAIWVAAADEADEADQAAAAAAVQAAKSAAVAQQAALVAVMASSAAASALETVAEATGHCSSRRRSCTWGPERRGSPLELADGLAAHR